MLKLSQADRTCSLVLCFKELFGVNRAFCDGFAGEIWKYCFPLTAGQKGNSGSFSEECERSDGQELILPLLFYTQRYLEFISNAACFKSSAAWIWGMGMMKKSL